MTFGYLNNEVIWELNNIYAPNIIAAKFTQTHWCQTFIADGEPKSIPLLKVKMSWNTLYKNDDGTIDVLKYVFDDVYLLDMTDTSNKNEVLDKMIKESQERYKAEFDKRKAGTIFRRAPLPYHEIIPTREVVLKLLREAGY
jgi:hypothetical protein